MSKRVNVLAVMAILGGAAITGAVGSSIASGTRAEAQASLSTSKPVTGKRAVALVVLREGTIGADRKDARLVAILYEDGSIEKKGIAVGPPIGRPTPK